MADNLLELNALQPQLLLAELIDKTKRCALTWDKVSHTSYYTHFIWGDDWHDVYVTRVRGGYNLDVLKNDRNVMRFNSYTNDQLAVLFYVIVDDLKNDDIRQIIQDINSLISCTASLEMQETHDNATLTLHPQSHLADVELGEIALYMANPSGTGSLEILFSSGTIKTMLSNVHNIAGVRVDQTYGNIFWCQVELQGGRPSGTTISCCGTNGDGATVVVNLPDYDGVRGFDLDKINKKIYFVVDKLHGSDNLVYDVKRCNYDGSNIESVVDGNLYICSPTSLTIDVKNQYVFWCDSHGLSEGYVHRSNFDGSGYVTLLSTNGYVREVCVHDNVLYIGGSGLLAKVNEQGGNEVLLPHTGLSIIDSIDVSESGVMYISDLGVKKVVRTDLNGNNLKVLVNDSGSRSSISCV